MCVPEWTYQFQQALCCLWSGGHVVHETESVYSLFAISASLWEGETTYSFLQNSTQSIHLDVLISH